MHHSTKSNVSNRFGLNILATGVLLCLLEIVLVLALVPEPGRWILVWALLALNILALAFLNLRRLRVQNRATAETRRFQEADHTLEIAYETLPYMRQGLNPETALKSALIIQKISGVAAVAITDREKVLSFTGAGCEKHPPGEEILAAAAKEAIAYGRTKIVDSQRQLNCPRRKACDCPLGAAVAVPLVSQGEAAGAVILFGPRDGEMPPHIVNLATGVAQLLGMQIELAELDRQAHLLWKAELDALRAQINPHFLFNTLNTIIMYSRINPEKARRLLVRLAEFFRQTLKSSGHFHTFHEELHYIRTYLYLEQARFQDRLKARYRIDQGTLRALVPVLTIQPIVENAVKYGIGQKVGMGTVEIAARVEEGILVVSISDDGVGMSSELLGKVLQPGFGSGNGVGLSNLWERLRRLYGEEFRFKMESKEGEGTMVTLSFPLLYAEEKEGLPDEIEGPHRGR